MKCLWFYLCLSILSPLGWAAEPLNEPETVAPNSLIAVNVGIELDGIQAALEGSNRSMQEMVEVLGVIATSQQLDTQQQAHVTATMENIDRLTSASAEAMGQLPGAILSAKESVASSSAVFYQDLKLTIMLILALLILGIVLLIACTYWFVLRPIQRTITNSTANIAQMTETVQLMASSLEKSGDNHLKILAHMPQKAKSDACDGST